MYKRQGPVSTWMGDRLQTGKTSRYVTATEVDSAFYPLRDGKMGISFRADRRTTYFNVTVQIFGLVCSFSVYLIVVAFEARESFCGSNQVISYIH